MQRKSKFRISPKSISKKSKISISIISVTDEILELRLSPETQSYVQCRIGDQISGDMNWIFILKSDILSSIEISYDFLFAIDLVKEYPEDKLLIGTYGFDESISEAFQLCTTVASKDKILNMIKDRRKKIEQIFNMPVFVWTSLGSETEVNGMQNYNLRNLLVVEIDSVFPIFIRKRIFTIQEANDAMYIEMFATRQEYKNIWRRRVDVACQTCGGQKNASVQTRSTSDFRHFTQYEEQIHVQTPGTEYCKRIVQFLDSHIYDIEDVIKINYHINLHINDYAQFSNPYIPHVYTNYKEIVACQDIKHCQGKQVSCVSWSPFISGLFAASYVRTSIDNVNTSEPVFKDTETFDEHLVLVWSFSDMEKPKIYLHSIREVTYISFCPYDENIIVGGCNNGQIVIWDIRGQLTKAETKEILSPIQLVNRNQMAQLTLWMKNLQSVGHVNACVSSSLLYGHKTAITNISWIPPDYFISTTGQFSKTLDDNLHMQFVTTSLEDGNVCVWDLKQHPGATNETRRKRLQRLSKIPSALHTDISPLKHKHAVFIPVFMLLVKDSITKKALHIRSMLFKNHEYHYKEVKSVKVENNFRRKYFKNLSPVGVVFDWEQIFVANTLSGKLFDCTWEGFTYDHGNKVNFDSCMLNSYVSIHDAPIRMCVVNKDEPNIYLSIGGKVFAIWHTKNPTPILWRKCETGFIFGKWTYAHPFEILLFTNDGFIQLWNFFLNSKSPIYTVRSHGMPPEVIYSNRGAEHYLKNALLLLDRFGAIRIHSAGSRLAAKAAHPFQTHESIKTFIDTKQQVQSCVAFWSKRYKKSKCEPAEEIKNEIIESTVVTEKIVQKKKMSKKEKFEKKEHKYMYEKLMACNGVQVKQLEMNRRILDEFITQSNERSKKCSNVLSNKVELFEKKKRLIVWNPLKGDRNIYRISLPEERANYLKKQYFEEYLLMEKQFSNQMVEYKYVFDLTRIETCKYRFRNSLMGKMKTISQEHVVQPNFQYGLRDTGQFTSFNEYDS